MENVNNNETKIVEITHKEYSVLGGWCSDSWYADRDWAVKIAANCQRGNANLPESPEEWAEEMIDKGQDFRCYKGSETCYCFRFLGAEEIERVNRENK